MPDLKKTLIVGLLAHVDAGKTTLAESLLYVSGRLRRLGRVDHRDAFLDTDVREKERGITIFSKQARLEWKNTSITLIDTPGHVDFSSETERAMSILDCAVIVISGASGVQAHTLTLWKLLESYNVPVFLFMNKMDHPDTDAGALLKEVRSRLSDLCVDMASEDAFEHIALCDEDVLSNYIDSGVIKDEDIASLVQNRKLFPCFFGSALKVSRVDLLLDALTRYTLPKTYPEAFSARVYKISRDGDARLTWMKITGGSLKVRDTLKGGENDGTDCEWEEKVAGIRLYSGAKYVTCDEVKVGGVCAVTGLSRAKAGDGLGERSESVSPTLESVFTYKMLPPRGFDPFIALQKLRILEEEDPQLHVVWNERLREIYVQLMGEVQLEIISRLMKDRFNIDVSFSEGSILYRETISAPAIGVGHYEPLRHYAEVRLLLEPGERASGMSFCTACPEDELDRNWQRLILTHLAEKRHVGVLTGSPITDIKITLLAGRAHIKHTQGGDFRQATYRAVRQGLMTAKSVVLEPWYDIRLELPPECAGRAMSDIERMGGEVSQPKQLNDYVILKAGAPVARARYYAREVAVYARGRGKVTLTPRGYEPCADQDGIIAEIGYNPLRDVYNTADSVFCSHGAGFVVSWDEAAKHMHIVPPRQESRNDEIEARPRVKKEKYDEEELIAIFERTYGAIKPRQLNPTRKEPVVCAATEIKPAKDECLLVDGYNIIFAWDELKKAASFSLAAARDSLADILSNYAGYRPCNITLVFDAYRVPDHPGESENYRNILVVYTKAGETADQYIEKTVYDIGKTHRVRVATSDGLEQMMILGDGALRLSATELHADIKAANIEIASILDENNRKGKTGIVENALRDAVLKKRDALKKDDSLKGD